MNKIISLLLLGSVLWCTSCRENNMQNIHIEPSDPVPHDLSIWENEESGLQVSLGSTNIAYGRTLPPHEGLKDNLIIPAWKGEQVNAILLFWSRQEVGEINLKTSVTEDNPAGGISNIRQRVVKYVLADSFINGCGSRDKDTIQPVISPDVLSEDSSFYLESQECRPVWLSLETASDCEPGIYTINTEIITMTDTNNISFEVEVIDRLLPPPSAWHFHLDLWQNPYAVARYHRVELWSQEHWNLMRPLLEKLASAGQKCITTTLNDKPWGGQTYDPYGSMVTWIKDDQGNWAYDFSVFDQYIDFAMSCGIISQINCYSMVPWHNRLVYYDESTAGYEETEVNPGTNEYNELWESFLITFREHLFDMGWLDITTIAIDEREEEDIKKVIELVRNNAPEIKISLAGNILQEGIQEDIYDLSVAIGIDPDTDINKKRVTDGKPTTFYTCCAEPEHPNNFTFSPPADNTYIGWYAASRGFSGFLRWAYNSWVEDPLYDSRFKTWPSGDTYLVYPGALSSVRFEKLVEGIKDYEKIRILVEELAYDPSMVAAQLETELSEFLASIHLSGMDEKTSAEIVSQGQELLFRIATR